jgi:hypothetical protein
VVERFVNDGPFVITALERAERVLRETGHADRIVELYASTWRRVDRPGRMAGVFMTQSNWYKIGQLYAAKLREAGDEAKADQIADELRIAVGGG